MNLIFLLALLVLQKLKLEMQILLILIPRWLVIILNMFQHLFLREVLVCTLIAT